MSCDKTTKLRETQEEGTQTHAQLIQPSEEESLRKHTGRLGGTGTPDLDADREEHREVSIRLVFPV